MAYLPWEVDDASRHNISRGRVVKTDDSKSQQMMELTGRKYQEPKKVWRPLSFGFTSVAPKDGDGFLYGMGGRSDRYIWQDAGHEKYRPKNTPEGYSALFNMQGDILRMFKDSADLVHSKKVNIRVGKGYKTGTSTSSGSGIDDESGSDTKTISIVADGDKIIITYQDASVKIEGGKITHTAPTVIVASPDVRLGGVGASTYIGLCGGGCSTTTKAI